MLSKKWNMLRHAVANKKLTGKGKKLFWVWVAYQTIKGILTTSLIWIPMIYLWLSR